MKSRFTGKPFHEFGASGEFDITDVTFNNLHQVGHFDSTNTSPATFDAIGFEVIENNQVNDIRMRAALYFSNGSSALGSIMTVGGFPNSNRLWSYTWDPTGGVNSLGRLSFTINGTGGGTSFVDLSAAHNGLDFSLDAFGMFFRGIGATDGSTPAAFFIDNVTYSSFIVVPEPGTVVLVTLGAIGLATMMRRRRR